MCRWAAYIGEPIFLSDVVLAPERSLVSQSAHALEAKTATNGDGFGLAWYGEREHPGVYCDVMPAWGDRNLSSIAEQVRSRLFLAHVRASTGTTVSRSNCHPFSVGKWSFMHNGQIGGFTSFRREVDMLLDNSVYHYRNGTTDSEAMFLLALGSGLESNPKSALLQTIGRLEKMSREQGTTPHMRVSLAVSDGLTLHVVRYASDDFAPTLYHRRLEGSKGRLVVSEPLDQESGCWEKIPPNSYATITPEGANITVFRD